MVNFLPRSLETPLHDGSQPVRVAIFVPSQDMFDALGEVYHTIFTGRE